MLCLDRLGQGHELIVLEGDEDQVHAAGRQRPDKSFADSRGRAGDDRGAPESLSP